MSASSVFSSRIRLGLLLAGPIVAARFRSRRRALRHRRSPPGFSSPAGAKTWLGNAPLTDIHRRSLAVHDFYFRGPLVEIAAAIIGPNVKGVTSQLTFKLRGNTKTFPWHQDSAYGELSPCNPVTCLTAFERNDRETGCPQWQPAAALPRGARSKPFSGGRSVRAEFLSRVRPMLPPFALVRKTDGLNHGRNVRFDAFTERPGCSRLRGND